MAEKLWGRPDQLIYPLGDGIAHLFDKEDIASPILREIAYSMWNKCLKLHEEGLVELQRDFTNIDEFIELMKSSGVPEEIRGNQEYLAKVLGAGIATFYEKEDIDSPLLREVVYHVRKGCGKVQREGPPIERMGAPPFRAMTVEELDQFLESANKMREPDDLEGKRWRAIERRGDTIFWQIEPPKDEAGNYICGCMLVRGGVLTTRTQLLKVGIICDPGILKNLVEGLVRHPVVVEQIECPAMSEGATSCYARIHLNPSTPVGRRLS